MQPDNPARGDGQQPAQDDALADDSARGAKPDTAAKQAKTSQTALENVREGYGS